MLKWNGISSLPYSMLQYLSGFLSSQKLMLCGIEKGRKQDGKYFHSLAGWKIESAATNIFEHSSGVV